MVFNAQFCQRVEFEECRHHVIAEVTAHSPWKSWLCVYICPQLCISDVTVVTETHQWECVWGVGLKNLRLHHSQATLMLLVQTSRTTA